MKTSYFDGSCSPWGFKCLFPRRLAAMALKGDRSLSLLNPTTERTAPNRSPQRGLNCRDACPSEAHQAE